MQDQEVFVTTNSAFVLLFLSENVMKTLRLSTPRTKSDLNMESFVDCSPGSAEIDV